MAVFIVQHLLCHDGALVGAADPGGHRKEDGFIPGVFRRLKGIQIRLVGLKDHDAFAFCHHSTKFLFSQDIP